MTAEVFAKVKTPVTSFLCFKILFIFSTEIEGTRTGGAPEGEREAGSPRTRDPDL